MGIISTGKGVAQVKSKLVKRTQYIPRLCGLSTKWLWKRMVREQGTGCSMSTERTLSNRANDYVS